MAKTEKEKKPKKEKKKYVPIEGLIGEAEDYHIYRMKPLDIVLAVIFGAAAGALLAHVFFGVPIVTVLFAGIGVVVGIPIMYRIKKKARLNDMLIQFKDLLEALSASYSVGKNTMDSFIDAKADMERIHGGESDIVKELQLILDGMVYNLRIEDLLSNWADRSGLDDIESFANVFEVANRQGADMKTVVNSSREIISQKITMEMELETMLSGNKNELNVMICMPVLIVFMIQLMGLGSLGQNTPLNVIVKVVCILVFAGAYAMGRAIIKIKV